jgi:2-dehydro-3-deoxyphosphooctonate aldolase (KDO 8-P synthase)
MGNISLLYEQLQHNRFLIAGPCVIESMEIMQAIAEELQTIKRSTKWTIIFKASFDKANRSSIQGNRGPGLEKGLEILDQIKKKYQFPILTDIHESWQAEPVAEVVDIIQIPAFLCRQTDLLKAAANTGKIVNVKKAQFLSGKDMFYVTEKLKSTGNQQILLTERGTQFGYNNLVVDLRGTADMMDYGYPVIMDCTHAVQKPGAGAGKSLGESQYIPILAKAAAAIGVKGFFMETHPSPDMALSDGPNMIPLAELHALIRKLELISRASGI